MNSAPTLFKASADAGVDTRFADPGASEMQLGSMRVAQEAPSENSGYLLAPPGKVDHTDVLTACPIQTGVSCQ
jgi:hypothetical protein